MFPYTFDYLQELPSSAGNYLEFLTLTTMTQQLTPGFYERHISRLMSDTTTTATTNLKVTVLGLKDIRADHLNQ